MWQESLLSRGVSPAPPAHSSPLGLVLAALASRREPRFSIESIGRCARYLSQQLGASKFRLALLNALMFLGAALYCASQVAWATDGVPSLCSALRCMNFW